MSTLRLAYRAGSLTTASQKRQAGRWMSTRDVAHYLGETEETIRGWFEDGTLPYVERGRPGSQRPSYRTTRAAVEAFAQLVEREMVVNQRAAQQRAGRFKVAG